jgi:hypothetical protein
MKEIGDRLDGKSKQSMDMVTHANKPIREMTDSEIAARLAELEAEIEGTANAAEGDAEAESPSSELH